MVSTVSISNALSTLELEKCLDFEFVNGGMVHLLVKLGNGLPEALLKIKCKRKGIDSCGGSSALQTISLDSTFATDQTAAASRVELQVAQAPIDDLRKGAGDGNYPQPLRESLAFPRRRRSHTSSNISSSSSKGQT